MKGLRKNLTFTALCLAVGLVVFGVSYTLLGQGPGGNVGDTTDGSSPEAPGEMLPGGEPGPVGQVSELFEVISGGNVEQLKQLLETGADPNATDDEGQAALHWAVLGSRISQTVYGQVQTLLAHGANPNQPANNGMTALHTAALYGSEAVVDTLIASGGDPNIATAEHTPYELALITDNTGGVAAIERVTDHQPKDKAMLEAMGVFARRMRQGVIGDTTTQEKETAVREAVRGLVKSGYITAGDGETIYQEAMKALQSHGCEDCGKAKGKSGEIGRTVSPAYGTHGNEALRGQGPRLCQSFISCHGRATSRFRIDTGVCTATLGLEAGICSRLVLPKVIAGCLAIATAQFLICEGGAVADRYYDLVACCDGQNPNDDPEYSGCGAWNRNCPPSWYR